MRVLMIAFQFPPFAGSSAVQRTLRFVRYLPEFGWEPLVVSAQPSAYDTTSDDLLAAVPEGTIVRRAMSLDTARHLGLFRRYPAVLARPDRWISWYPAAVWTSMRLVRRYRPDVIWSTFPIPTAHLIGLRVAKLAGLPWVADFRDPMVQPGDPADPALWRTYERVEQRSIAAARLNVFTTEGTRALYERRYPDLPGDRLAVVENGYDEEVFAEIEPVASRPSGARPLEVVHSGAIYPLERDPTSFFRALAALRDAGRLPAATLRVRLRATHHDRAIRQMIDDCRVGDLVELAPVVPYREAIREMMHADGLLVLQAGQVSTQVPAKLYEYLRAGRPILGLTPPDGESARTLRAAGIRHIAPIDDPAAIAAALTDWLHAIAAGSAPQPDARFVAAASRRSRTRELAHLLGRVADEHPRRAAEAQRSR